MNDPLMRAERAIVRALKEANLGGQSQVTHEDRFEIATDDVVVWVWTVEAYDRVREAVNPRAS
jgi:hypothetical protein